MSGQTIMPDFEMCLSETCPASGRCRRHKASGTNPSPMQAYGYHEPGANGRCDVYLPRYEAEFPGWDGAFSRHADEVPCTPEGAA